VKVAAGAMVGKKIGGSSNLTPRCWASKLSGGGNWKTDCIRWQIHSRQMEDFLKQKTHTSYLPLARNMYCPMPSCQATGIIDA
jgi:hypothetical protein